MSKPNELDRSESLLAECEAVIGYTFSDQRLLKRCLTHSSLASTRLASNERLEFLGAIVCEMLYRNFPEYPEGELTRIKSVLVSRNVCAEISDRLGLERFLLLGKGLSTFDKIPMSIKAAVFESLVAGIYLDGGLGAARAFIELQVQGEIEQATQPDRGKNYKSLLQQYSQKTYGETPVYRLLDEKGPDHSKCFMVSAVIGMREFPAAWGANKKEAEQRAASNALETLQADFEPEPGMPGTVED
jgi:ribonuclease-3